jgi:serine/threonine protein kinase
MLEPGTAINLIFKIAQSIYSHVGQVKANVSQCQRMAERIKIVTSSIKFLEAVKDKEQYKLGLNALHTCLSDCAEFIQLFLASNVWFKYILKTSTYKQRFTELYEQLQAAMLELNLGLTAQHIINREEDKADEEADYRSLLTRQEEILKLNVKAATDIQKLSLEDYERHEIVVRQLASIEERLKKLNVNPSMHLIDQRYTVSFFELQFKRKIGEGSFGKVYLGDWKEQTVAIKTIESSMTEEAKNQFVREIKIMSNLRNNCITQFYGACLESERACILMEYMEKGSLYDILEKNALSPEQQQQIALNIARGLYYLHTQGILHRDLKSANVLVNEYWQAKLADFGLSGTKAASVETIKERSQAIQWQAPECFQRGKEYTQQSDIYSYGMILWEIVTGRRPYAKIKVNLINYILENKREEIPDTVHREYAALITACWDADPAKRPELQAIIHQLETYVPRSASPTPEGYYEQGIAFEKKREYCNAIQCYQKSSDKGHFRATTNLGFLFLKGKGVAANKQRAYECFLRSANEGHVRAMVNLAMMLEHGDGINKNLMEAKTWYKKAADNGDEDAKKKYGCLK